MIPVPSFEKDDVNRGFNHVEEIFKEINLKTCKIIHKIKHVKQAKNNMKERKIARHVFRISEDEKITGKKVLIVDDVSTTGETLKAIVDLVKGARPKQIKILVMSKRIL